MFRFVRRLVRRSWLGTALGFAVMMAPWPAFQEVFLAVGAVVAIGSLGKGLYDTLFYDHYWP